MYLLKQVRRYEETRKVKAPMSHEEMAVLGRKVADHYIKNFSHLGAVRRNVTRKSEGFTVLCYPNKFSDEMMKLVVQHFAERPKVRKRIPANRAYSVKPTGGGNV